MHLSECVCSVLVTLVCARVCCVMVTLVCVHECAVDGDLSEPEDCYYVNRWVINNRP